MCSGLRDAANLAWKLERIIRNGAPSWLLDTYGPERGPHARKVIEAAIRIGKVICELDAEVAAERDRLLLSGDKDERRKLAFALPPFEPGPLVLEKGGQIFPQPRIDGKLLDEIVGMRFLVLARSEKALGNSAAWWRDRAGALVATLDEISAPGIVAWLDRREADVVVVRPDRYVLGTAGSLDKITPAVAGLLGEAA
jgi:3-(3-hydroxy-phenyl)propionate hydroxylase